MCKKEKTFQSFKGLFKKSPGIHGGVQELKDEVGPNWICCFNTRDYFPI